MNQQVKWHVTRVFFHVGRPWGLRKKGRHNGSRCRGSSGFGFGFLKMTRLRKSCACLSSTSKNLLSSHWGFMKIDDKNLDTRCFIDNRLYMVSQLHLANRWYEVSTTSGTSTALPTAVEFSSGVVFMCFFCFERFMEDSIKNSLGEMKDSNLILL